MSNKSFANLPMKNMEKNNQKKFTITEEQINKMLQQSINKLVEKEAVLQERFKTLSQFSTAELVAALCANRNMDEVKKLLDEKRIVNILKD